MDPLDAADTSRWFREMLGVPELIRVVGKRPIDPRWTQGPREEPELARALLEEWHGNLGMLTGQLASGLYLVVTDADLHHEGAEDSLHRLYELGLPRRTVTVLTGGHGEHLYCTSPVPIPSRPLGPEWPGIDIKCVGGMVVVPYSIHPETGELYEWDWGYGLEDCKPAALPPAVIELYGTTTSSSTSVERAERDLENADYETAELLEKHYGAHRVVERTGSLEVTRPGKARGVSATVGAVGAGVVRVWSSNWPGLPAGTYDNRALRARAGVRDPAAARIAAVIPTKAPPPLYLRAAEVRSRRQGWLWRGLVPEGHFMLTAGREELGKSSAMLWLSARITKGELPGDLEGKPADVLYCSLEDDADRVLKPRAVAAMADLERLWFLDPAGAGFALDAVHELAPKLVVLDPISSFVGLPANNEHGEHVVRGALAPLIAYAIANEATVIGVRHVRKGGANESPYDAILGSRAWSAAPRAHLIFAPDRSRTDEIGGLMFPRGNLARGGVVHRYRLEETTVDLDQGGFTTVPLFVLEGAGVGIDLEAAMRPAPTKRGPAPAQLDYAKEWLELALVEAVPAKQLAREAKQCGISEITLKRARKELGVETRPRRAANGKRRWWCSMPSGSSSEGVSPSDPLLDPLSPEHPEIPVIEPSLEDAQVDPLTPRGSIDPLTTDDREE